MARRADPVGPTSWVLPHRIRSASFPSLNQFFVHQEDVRRANGLGSRDTLTPALQAALWRNVRRGGRYLSRRLRGVGLEIEWAGTHRANHGSERRNPLLG